MNAKRVFWLMSALIVILSGLAIGGVIIGNIVLQKQASKLFDLKLQNKVLDEEQASLVQANKDIQKYADLEKIAKTIVPQDKDQAKAVREIVSLASGSGITLKSISFPSSTLGQAPVKSTSDSGTTTKITAPPISQVKAVDGIPGVYSMEITIQSDDFKPVSYRSFLDFLGKLEQNRRTAQVATINIQPNTKAVDSLSFTITLNLYIKP